jgi:GGDEF domain-containing protein
VFDEIHTLAADGRYEQALAAAKRLSIELLKQQRRDAAALALGLGGEILCSLNQPGKARSWCSEALDLAARAGSAAAGGYAQAVNALAHLRLGEIDKAEAALDGAFLKLAREPETPFTAAARLIGAEVALAADDVAEALAFADDAHRSGVSLDLPVVRARATLIRAVCAERADELDRAHEFLRQAEGELALARHVETLWQVRAALASTAARSGQEKAAGLHQSAARETVQAAAQQLSEEARERYLKNPAIAAALGSDKVSASGVYKVPVQVQARPPLREVDEKSLAALRPIFEVIKKINSEHNLRRLIVTILDTMIEMANAERGTLVIFEGDKFKFEVSRGRAKTDLKPAELGVSRTVLKVVRERGRRIVADDAQQDPELRLIDSVHEHQLLSLLCLPIRAKLRLLGAVYLDNPHVTAAFGSREQEIAEILTEHAAVAIENALLHIQSIHDGLTHLYNHSHFEKRLEAEVARCRRHGRPCGLLMLDVDNFKEINDTLGHEAGNETLKGISKLLAAAVRSADLVARRGEDGHNPVVARYGGDEFEVILPETGREGIQKVADRILQALEGAGLAYQGKPVPVTVSIGGASFPADAPEARELILRADEALYRAKRTGKRRYVAYSAS